MKRTHFFLLVIFLLNSVNVFCQWDTNYEQVQLTMKNGNVLNGYARLQWVQSYLDFKDENKKNKVRFDFTEINKAEFTVFEGKKNAKIKREFTLDCLVPTKEDEIKKNRLMAALIFDSDVLKIYAVKGPSSGGFGMTAGLGGSVSSNYMKMNDGGRNYSEYYCFVKDEKYPRVIYKYTSLKTFRIMASQCFKDCEELSRKINDKLYTIDNMYDIAEFYISNCK
ncbi:MAG: hypothetical protein RLZZ540_2719 [Bacteroidota bacterium]|jgi:hypothetical protein